MWFQMEMKQKQERKKLNKCISFFIEGAADYSDQF